MFEFPNIDPVAFSIGPFVVRWYALAYLTGFIGGWRYALWMAKKAPNNLPTRDQIDDFLVWAILGVILGGRIGYVLFYQPDIYLNNPWDAFTSYNTAQHYSTTGTLISVGGGGGQSVNGLNCIHTLW